MTADGLRALMRKEIGKLGSQRAYARSAGVSVAYVSDILLGRRSPGPAVAKHHGYTCKTVVKYERIYRKEAR